MNGELDYSNIGALDNVAETTCEVSRTDNCSRIKQEFRPNRAIGLEPGPDAPEYLTGRDPRQMTADDLQALGHLPMSPLKALRLHCIDCCCGSTVEVLRCVSVFCPCWPFRMGENPWRSPPSEAKRESGRTLAGRRCSAENRQQKRSSGDDKEGRATPIAGTGGESEEGRSERPAGDSRNE